jgi:long-subunit acyl-CoA synthetase (AMP-forming)
MCVCVYVYVSYVSPISVSFTACECECGCGCVCMRVYSVFGSERTHLWTHLRSSMHAGYLTSDQPYPRGEICIWTRDLCKGYYRDAKATQTAFRDGWFHTGDIGQVVDGRIQIIDRVKNIIK